MLATLSNLPKWLLALVALCILAGYAEQVECKTVGCKSAVASALGENEQSAPAHGGEQDCHCQCHFTTLTFGATPTTYVSFVRVVVAHPSVWVSNTPEAPCADIEHPPQLA